MNKLHVPRREAVGRILVCILRALLGALLSGAQVLGGYAPFAVGAVGAAGPGWEGLGALVGVGLGALALLDFPHALRTMACCVLIFTANNAFCELKAYKKPWFLSTMTAGLMLTVEAIYAIRSGSLAAAAYCVAATALAALFAPCCRLALESEDARREHPAAALMLLTGILTALGAAQFESGLAPGRAVAVLAVLFIAFDRDMASSLASALCIGLAMDISTARGEFLHAACYGFAALLTGFLRQKSRLRAAGIFALAVTLFSLPLGLESGTTLLCEGLAGTLMFLLLPSRALRSVHAATEDAAEAREDSIRGRLRESAEAIKELYEGVANGVETKEENPAIIFDRAAEAVCRDCALRETCWELEYRRTFNAMSEAAGALLENGEGSAGDFPQFFSERCVRFTSFLAAVNSELRAFRLRRQYRVRLRDANARSAAQYAQLSELLRQAAERPVEAAGTALLDYRIGLKLRPKNGELISGDSAESFETGGGELCLLLSDGMGSGEDARRESSFAVHLIERLLRAGIDAPPTLRTINSALSLRAEYSDSFVTVDLLTLSLKSGEGELYKYGAAPSYVKRGRRVHRVGCACLPAGLADGAAPPEQTHIRLEAGSFLVMVTDGVADATDDEWLRTLLAEWEGENPQMLVSSILADSYAHKGTADDAGVMVLYLPERGGGAKEA
ncbi:MAG: SpoIIE family protein phosphatase [Oscillospiraceae bacterium]|nr:SpoIIE family protein phosphatase [Oscillospiraceae bacterium]